MLGWTSWPWPLGQELCGSLPWGRGRGRRRKLQRKAPKGWWAPVASLGSKALPLARAQECPALSLSLHSPHGEALGRGPRACGCCVHCTASPRAACGLYGQPFPVPTVHSRRACMAGEGEQTEARPPALGSLALDVARDYGALSSSPNLQPGEPLPHSLIERARIPGGPSTCHTQKQQQLEGKHSDIPAGETGRSAAPGHCAAPTSAPRIPSQTPQALPTAPIPK